MDCYSIFSSSIFFGKKACPAQLVFSWSCAYGGCYQYVLEVEMHEIIEFWGLHVAGRGRKIEAYPDLYTHSDWL